MDALADILKAIRLHTSTYFCSDFNTNWGMDIAHSKSGLFHVIVEGKCWVKIQNREEPIYMNEGDIVAFPTGGAHWISNQPESEKHVGDQIVEQILEGKNPFFNEKSNVINKQTLLCGAFEYDTSISHPFLRDLPCFIHIQANESSEFAWLKELVSVLARESKHPSPGSSVIIDRLTEVLFIQILRNYVQIDQSKISYMSALNDSKIGPILNQIHAEEHAQWTVEKLANEASLSRSSFTERFIRLVGEPPKTYLINWRMQKAKTKLESTELSMFKISESAGYSSESAFSKAFKQYFNVTPGTYRKR